MCTMGCGCPHPIILGTVPCDQNWLETHSLPIHSESQGPTWGHLVEARIRRALSWVFGHPAPPGSRSPCAPQRETGPAPSGCLRRQGPSIMRICVCLGRAGAEHHAHQRVSGEGRGRASCASAGVWGASNPVQSKSNEIKFRWTCEKQIHRGGGEGGGEGVLQVSRIRIERLMCRVCVWFVTVLAAVVWFVRRALGRKKGPWCCCRWLH